ncbi:collagen alpha-1(I) chain-like [Canis lupus dingo]|uniref:collagen alpha-1(I) chain-like n=1 Tax=Canis lupus dingo TaxID=286419 RepID=UPI000DC6C305|nr:collagen alpha-1(I) chain-like [Canis lupus dingo]
MDDEGLPKGLGGPTGKQEPSQQREGRKPSGGFNGGVLARHQGVPCSWGDLGGLRVSSSGRSPAGLEVSSRPRLGQGPDGAREEDEGRSSLGSGPRRSPVAGHRARPQNPQLALQRPAPGGQSPVALRLDVRPSGRIRVPSRGTRSPSRVPGREGGSAGPPAGPTARGQRGRAGGPARPAPRGGRSRACRRALGRPPGAPDAARPRTHTPRARARAVRYFPAPDPASGRGPEPSPGRRGWGRGRRLGPGPRGDRAPPPQPLWTRALGPPRRPPAARGGPGGSGRAAGGAGVGAEGRGLRADRRLGSAPGKVWTWETPSRPPRREEGARGGRARAPGLPLRRGGSPPAPPAGPLPPARGLPPGPPASPRRRSAAPPAAPLRPYLGERPGAAPGPAASGRCVRRAGGRVRSPAAARRSRRESGRERGSRGGVCARVCERESEGARE